MQVRIDAVVLAAGASRRFGSAKQLALLDGRPLVEHALAAASAASGVRSVLVTLGAHADAVEAAVDLHGATVVRVPDWDEGLAASLRAGVAAAAADDADAVVVLLGDQPRVAAAEIERVAGAIADGAAAARATVGGVPGHPVAFRRELYGEIAALRGDAGARDLLVRAGAVAVACGPEAIADVDTPAQLAALDVDERAPG